MSTFELERPTPTSSPISSPTPNIDIDMPPTIVTSCSRPNNFELCSICLDKLNTNPYLFFCSKCKNKFHQECIIRMLNYNISKHEFFHFCPLCRGEIIIKTTTISVNRKRYQITSGLETTPLIDENNENSRESLLT